MDVRALLLEIFPKDIVNIILIFKQNEEFLDMLIEKKYKNKKIRDRRIFDQSPILEVQGELICIMALQKRNFTRVKLIIKYSDPFLYEILQEVYKKFPVFKLKTSRHIPDKPHFTKNKIALSLRDDIYITSQVSYNWKEVQSINYYDIKKGDTIRFWWQMHEIALYHRFYIKNMNIINLNTHN